MTSLKTINEMREKFEETRLAKEGGSSFECSDYEGIYADMKSHLLTTILAILEGMRVECEKEKVTVDYPDTDDGRQCRHENSLYNSAINSILQKFDENIQALKQQIR
jgi:hypothetical protein